MSIFPTSFETLMAEDLRQEVGGKLTVIGFYVGDDIVLLKDAVAGPDVVLPKLAFLTRLRDGEGTWAGKWSIIGPDNTVVVKSNDDFKITKDAGVMHGVITITPLTVAKLGDYKYLLELDGHPYEFRFRIKK